VEVPDRYSYSFYAKPLASSAFSNVEVSEFYFEKQNSYDFKFNCNLDMDYEQWQEYYTLLFTYANIQKYMHLIFLWR